MTSPSYKLTSTNYSLGSVMLLVVIFGGIFFTMLTAFASYVLVENRAQDIARSRAEAFNIAEAGLDYYRWFLSHFPGDITNGTGHDGPYVVPYSDPESGVAGTYTLTIASNNSCGSVQSIEVTSKGTPSGAPNISSTLAARYAAPSVAAYSYIVGSSVWAGSDRIINGPYHSNGGVRMDGTANAPVSSSLSTWNCTSSFGCSPDQPSAPGVVGTGGNQNLWEYPIPQMDFSGIAANFSALKSAASANGIYLPQYSSGNVQGAAYKKGYHLIFNSNGTVTVKRVTSINKLTNVYPIDYSSSYTDDYTVINNETSYNTYTIPSGCGLIFVEDNTWIEGVVPSKVTVVAAGVVDSSFKPDIILRGNITYGSADGTSGLTVISSHNILISGDSPQNMTLNGIFVAQSGAFGRNFYRYALGGGCNGTYEPRGTLTILGTTVSNLRTGTAWTNGCGTGVSAGYQTRIDSFDRQNATSPPPFTPMISTQWKFVDWQQK
jgi:hypothetical protein